MSKPSVDAGYDVGITGGVTSMENFLRLFFPHVATQSEEGSTNKWCTYNDAGLQMFTSSLFLAACLAGLAASPITRYICFSLWWLSTSQASWGASPLNMHLSFLFWLPAVLGSGPLPSPGGRSYPSGRFCCPVMPLPTVMQSTVPQGHAGRLCPCISTCILQCYHHIEESLLVASKAY